MSGLAAHCVATAGNVLSSVHKANELNRGNEKRRKLQHSRDVECFTQAQFSKNGRAIITQNGGQALRSFNLPSDLFDKSEQQHLLESHIVLDSPTPIQSYAIHPDYDLQDPSTTLILSSSKDLPISLSNSTHTKLIPSNYPLINPTTEAHITASSLLWTKNGTHFIAGSANQFAIFDAEYPGSGPVATHKTAQSKHQARATGMGSTRGCKGTITTLSASHDGVLAAGTRQRNIALYQQEGSGEYITHFSLAPAPGHGAAFKGTGVTQLAWDPSGTYLLVAERQSDGISVFDMRNTYQRVAWLSGRKAMTLQKLGIDVLATAPGYEVWAGGTDGCVRAWRDPGTVEGVQEPDAEIKVHDGAVASAIWHPQGEVLATCCGTQDRSSGGFDSLDDSDDGETTTHLGDNSLKLWTLDRDAELESRRRRLAVALEDNE